MNRRTPEHVRRACAADYLAGMSSIVVARKHGVSARTVARAVAEAGGEMRRIGRPPRPEGADAYNDGWVRDGLILRPVKPRTRLEEVQELADQGRRARAAYYQENHCRCGVFVGRIQSRQQPRCADCARQKAKNNRVRRTA